MGNGISGLMARVWAGMMAAPAESPKAEVVGTGVENGVPYIDFKIEKPTEAQDAAGNR